MSLKDLHSGSKLFEEDSSCNEESMYLEEEIDSDYEPTEEGIFKNIMYI